MADDAALLLDYARTRNADAFAQLVRRYAGLVYGACLRVIGDPHGAEDVAQECFMELARHAGSVGSPLPAWLHVAAVNRSRNALRNAARRKRHEEQAMSAKDANSEPRWADVAPCVDQALAELPEGLRVPLLLHYLNGLTQSQVATELGIDQSTVSRRIEKGLDELRARLRKAGVVASVAVLGTLLAENAAPAAPASLTMGLAKMAMAGVGSGAASGAATAALGSVWGKVAVAVAAGLAIAGGTVVYRHATRPSPPARADALKPAQPPVAWDDSRSVPPKENVMPKPPAEPTNVRREGNRVWIEGVPHGQGNSNSYARGLAIVLNYAGTLADYDTIMGLSGMAFITQSDLGTPLVDGAIDVGWWPKDSWGLRIRLDFLSRAVGRRLRAVDCDRERFLADPTAHYGERFELEVKGSIAAGRPVLAEHNTCFVVHGYDEGNPPLLGNWAPEGEPGIIRIPEQPWGLIVLGDELGALDQRTADLESLRHAVALWNDTAVGAGGVDSSCHVRKLPENRGLRFTGRRSLAEWARLLRDTEHLGQPRYHANMCFHLGINRRSAVAYLRAMAARHPEGVAAHLNAAADRYGQVLAELAAADTGGAAMASPDGREKLAKLAERIAATEAEAIAELEKALPAAGIEAPAAQPQPGKEAKMLEGLKQRPMWMTHMGCLVGSAEFLKVEATPAWICGGCGQAFALNVHEVICPSGPTAWCAEKCDALASNLGLKVEDHSGNKRSPNFAQDQKRIWEKTREAIDAGQPCFGWDLAHPDWFVVTGYDAEGNYLFTELNGAPLKRHHTKLGDTEIGLAIIRSVRRCAPADDRTVVREALRFALEHGAGKHSNEKWHTGLPGYDTWIAALRDEKLANEPGRGHGQAYNAQCWAECRRHAVAFLEEADRRLADPKLAPLFADALKHYRIVAEQLGTIARLFPQDFPNHKAMDARLRDAALRATAVEALRAARTAEAAGLNALGDITTALGAK